MMTKEEAEKFNVAREWAKIELDKAIRYGKSNDGRVSYDLLPCMQLGDIIHRKEPLKDSHLRALKFLVKDADRPMLQGIADYLLEEANKYNEDFGKKELVNDTL